MRYSINLLAVTLCVLVVTGCSSNSPLKNEPSIVGSRQVGEFRRDGEYVKDYFFLKEGGTFHLFYNVGKAGPKQDWEEAGNEEAFGHATSKDLKNWMHHERVLPIVPGTWEGKTVSAPSIVKHDGTFYMVYSGFDDRVHGKQTIGLATSKDLFHWERYAGNPVYTKPDWTITNPNGWADCRDANIIRYKNEFLIYTMVTTKEGHPAISLASSPDGRKWTDLGLAVTTVFDPESPCVFEHDGNFYMFVSSALGKKLFKSKDPKSKNWEEVLFTWPSPGLWSGWEAWQDGKRTIFSAFEWKMDGNFIRFWEVEWHGETPVLKY